MKNISFSWTFPVFSLGDNKNTLTICCAEGCLDFVLDRTLLPLVIVSLFNGQSVTKEPETASKYKVNAQILKNTRGTREGPFLLFNVLNNSKQSTYHPSRLVTYFQNCMLLRFTQVFEALVVPNQTSKKTLQGFQAVYFFLSRKWLVSAMLSLCWVWTSDYSSCFLQGESCQLLLCR